MVRVNKSTLTKRFKKKKKIFHKLNQILTTHIPQFQYSACCHSTKVPRRVRSKKKEKRKSGGIKNR